MLHLISVTVILKNGQLFYYVLFFECEIFSEIVIAIFRSRHNIIQLMKISEKKGLDKDQLKNYNFIINGLGFKFSMHFSAFHAHRGHK